MKPVGYFNTPRSLFNHAMFEEEPMTKREALMWLIASAAYEPTRVRVNNGRSWETIDLQRGQLSFSLSFLRAAWKWTSEKKVRTFLERLQREGFIHMQGGQQTGAQGRSFPPVITICNYNVYPFVRSVEGAVDEPLGAIKGPAMGRQTGHQSGHQASVQVIENKEVLRLPNPKRAGNGPANGPEEEEVKERKSAPEGFEDWYAIYPRKKSRADAERAFTKVVPSLIALPVLMEKTRSFAAIWEGKPEAERKYIPYPASWLNAAGYDDEPDVKPAPLARDPQTFTAADWQKRLTYFQETESWAPTWGPMPGKPGCLVPRHLLMGAA
jgi:hypothetical protein